MTAYTHTATGSVATAENERFRWFFMADGYVFDKQEGRDLYLPVGGYSKVSGFGSDPAQTDVVAAARDFVGEVYAENDRIKRQAKASAQAKDADALNVMAAIPTKAAAELAQVNAELAARTSGINEGGDGYVPQADWTSKTGRDILGRHGLAQDQIEEIARASNVLAA